MQIVALDAKTLKMEELDLSPWRALGTLSLYDRTDPALVPQRLRGADVVLTNKVRLTAEALKGAPSVKMIGVLATGYDVVDITAARARALGIPVCNVPGYAAGGVTESVFAFLLEMTRRTYQSTARIRQGAWTACPEFCWWEKTPMALEGKTLGVVGCGAIGSRVAAVGLAFGMRVLGYARHEHPAFPGKQVPLEELLAASDVISLHCPATAENMGFINAPGVVGERNGRGLGPYFREAGGLRGGRGEPGAHRHPQPPPESAQLLSHGPLRLVVPVMAESDHVRAQGVLQPPKEGVSELSRRRLQGEALAPCQGGRVPAFAEQGHPQLQARLPAEAEVRPGLRAPDAVLVMGRVQGADPPLVPEPPQFQQQRRGVGPAGECAHHSLPPVKAAGRQRSFRQEQHGYQTPIIIIYIIPFAPLFDKSFL